jgi:predicted transglutaminase-like cysteine proteinase
MMSSRYLSYLSAVIGVLYFAFSPITAARAQSPIDGPFGLSMVEAPEAPLSATWKGVLLQVNDDLPFIAQCRAERSSCSSPAALKFLGIVQEGEHQDGQVRIAYINRAANAALRAVNRPHTDDEWRPPLGALSKGAGDCKHYAVLKYAALSEAGIAQAALKIVVVEVRSTHEQHAMVAVRTEGRWLLLDNRTSTLIESSKALAYYDPLYALDQDGVRQFALPSHPVQMAGSDKPAY